MKTATEILKAHRDFVTQTITALMALPAAAGIAAQIAELKQRFSAHLESLPAEAPAAPEASLPWLADSVKRCEEFATATLAQLSTLAAALSAKTLALHGLEEQVAKKELLPKAEVTELCKLEREAGRKEVLGEVVAMRKTAVSVAKLPEAPENVLQMNATEFNSAIALAGTHLTQLEDQGIKSETIIARRLIWADKEAFATELNALAEVRGSERFESQGGGARGGAGGAGQQQSGEKKLRGVF